jgi:hypothetical protein
MTNDQIPMTNVDARTLLLVIGTWSLVLLISAVAVGALPGFGKLPFEHPATHEKLAAVPGD